MAVALADAPVFDAAERSLFGEVLAEIRHHNVDDALLLSRKAQQVAELSAQLAELPSLTQPSSLGGQVRTGASLIKHLCKVDALGNDLDLPFKGTLSHTLLIAKIQFLRACVKAIVALRPSNEGLHALNLRLREELAQSIYTQLVEEILLALLRKPDVDKVIKLRAAEQLIAIWDDAKLEIDDFCPQLESVWRARNCMHSGLGSLLGASEYFRLVSESCHDEFLDFFARNAVSEPEQQAFEEFLFNMTYEELTALRAAMRADNRDCVSEDYAKRVLHRSIDQECESDEIDPVTIYRSYYRRQLAADFRTLAGSDGPRRTAEAYLMVYLLDRNGRLHDTQS